LGGDAAAGAPSQSGIFAPNETAGADVAAGRVNAELVAPYRPGIRVLAPGEIITAGALAALRAARAEGSRIAYAANPSLATFRVVAGR
jgi:lysine decarboxylase